MEKEADILHRIADLKAVGEFSFDGSIRAARVASVVDGDTVWLVMMHENEPRRFRVRLIGIDTPEMRPPRAEKAREHIKREAVNAKNALEQKLGTVNNVVHAHCHHFGKYGRILVTLYTPKGENLNKWLVDSGYAVLATGGRIAWSEMWPQLQKRREEKQEARRKAGGDRVEASRSMRPVEVHTCIYGREKRWKRVLSAFFGCCSCQDNM